MKTNKYAKRSLLLILFAFFIGGYQTCSGQSNQLSDVVIPLNELGISIEEYQAIQDHIVIELPTKSGPLTLELERVYKINIDGGEGREVKVKLKPIPFLPMVDYYKKEEDHEKD